MARAGILLISFPIRIKKSLARPYNILMKMQGKSSIVHRFPKLLVLYFVRHLELFVLNHSWRYKYDSRGDLIATTVVGCWSSTCTWSNQMKLGHLGAWVCFAMWWLFGLFVCLLHELHASRSSRSSPELHWLCCGNWKWLLWHWAKTEKMGASLALIT